MAEAPAARLAAWACALEPTPQDLQLAERALRDTVAVMCAASDDPLRDLLGPLTEAGRWAALAHVLDYDDLHLPSTTHISAVCVPAVLATEGELSGGAGARAYLAGAGVMARLGTALGWEHYSAGWHATGTAGAPAAAVAAGTARGLDAERIAVAIALSIASAGGVQRAFGTAAKSLQVAAAVEAGLRAAALAEAGAGADVRAVDDWMRLMQGQPDAIDASGTRNPAGPEPAVPGGLAVKLYPCCYALQRPISAVRTLPPIDAEQIRTVTVHTPENTLAPLIHRRPRTGLEGKFSLEYGVAAALLDGNPGLESFTDAAVRRPQAVRLIEAVGVQPEPAGQDLLAGRALVEVEVGSGQRLRSELAFPPGSPQWPPSEAELRDKLAICAPQAVEELAGLTWDGAAAFMRANGKLFAGF